MTAQCSDSDGAPPMGAHAWALHVVCALADPDSHRQQLAAVMQRISAGARRHWLLDGPEVEAEMTLVAGFKALAGTGVDASDGVYSKDYLPARLLAQSLAQGFSLVDLGRALRRLLERGTFMREVVGQHRNHRPKCVLRLANDEPHACVGPCAKRPPARDRRCAGSPL